MKKANFAVIGLGAVVFILAALFSSWIYSTNAHGLCISIRNGLLGGGALGLVTTAFLCDNREEHNLWLSLSVIIVLLLAAFVLGLMR